MLPSVSSRCCRPSKAQNCARCGTSSRPGSLRRRSFAKAVDRLQPLLLNYVNGGIGWQQHGVRAAQVRDLNRSIEAGAPELWRYAQGLIEDAIRRGYLAP